MSSYCPIYFLPLGPRQVSDAEQTPPTTSSAHFQHTRKTCVVQVGVFGFFHVFSFFFFPSRWQRVEIDGIALCRSPGAAQVPADWLRLLCSKKGNYNVNVSQQESEPGERTSTRWWRESSHRALTGKRRRGSVSNQTLIGETHLCDGCTGQAVSKIRLK